MPGCLEYVWALCRPAFVSGLLPETAWCLASMIPVAPLPPLTSEALRLLGVDAAGMRAIRNICANFVRVAPINLLFAGAVERALLVSNWPVETTSARALTTGLFRKQAAHTELGRVEALRQTMLELIDGHGYIEAESSRTMFSYAHPIFWAPFSLVGEGSRKRIGS